MKREHTHIDLLMKKAGIKTDLELAKALKFSQQQLSFRLNNKISMDTLEKLADFFKVSVKDMLE